MKARAYWARPPGVAWVPASRERDCPLKVAVELPHRKRAHVEQVERMRAVEEEPQALKQPAGAGLPKIVVVVVVAALLQRRARHANFLRVRRGRQQRYCLAHLKAKAVMLPLRPSGAAVVATRAKSFAELAVERLCSPAGLGANWAAVGEAVPRQMPMVRGRAP